MSTDLALKILFLLFSLYAGVMTWLFKTAWQDIQNLKRDYASLKTETLESIRALLDERFDRFEERLDEKFDASFTKLECTWMNEGRISPKKPRGKEKAE